MRILLRGILQRWYAALDDERVIVFQYMYYIIFMVAGVYMFVFASGPPQNVEPVMGYGYYLLWCAMNIVSPASTIVGKHFTKRAVSKEINEPNAAYGAAWLQLTGDFGTWSAVCIYLVCFLQTSYWGQGVYGVFFVFMGVPGGFMFTVRSLRRLQQIRRREKAL